MGKTLLISSHILADLEEICTDVAIIELGKIVWSGSLPEVRNELRRERFEVCVEVPEENAVRAAEILRALEWVKQVDVTDGKIAVKMQGLQGNQVLETLIKGGIEIHSFSQEHTNLEAIFLERTQGIVS